MAQFDVYENQNNRTKAIYPYLLDVQNELLEDLATRLVVPITKKSNLNHHQFTKLTPEVSFNDEKLLLMVPQMASFPTNKLRIRVGSLLHFRDEIIGAVDFALTGI